MNGLNRIVAIEPCRAARITGGQYGELFVEITTIRALEVGELDECDGPVTGSECVSTGVTTPIPHLRDLKTAI